MAKFKVLKPYKDLKIGRRLKPNEIVDMTVKRSEEVSKAIKEQGYEGEYLERIDNKEDEEQE